MARATLLYGPSFSNLRNHAFSRASTDATSQPGSVLLLDANDAQLETHRDTWAKAGNRTALQLNTEGLASFVSRAHDRLVTPTPDVGTQERQRILEQALDGHDGIEDARRYVDQFSELFRELEAHGAFSTDDVSDFLSNSDVDPSRTETVVSVFESYVDIRNELAHPHAEVRSRQFLNVADASGPLAVAFPEIEHVIVSGYVDPTPVELAVFERLASEFPMTIVLPATQRETTGASDRVGPTPDGTDSILSTTLSAYSGLDLDPEYVEPANEGQMIEIASRLYTPATREEPLDATGQVTWHEAPTPDREVRHLARRLRELLATTDTDPAEVLVLAPGLLSYRDRIDDVFAEYEVPQVASVSILLERTYAGRAVLDAIGLCANPDTEQLARLATNPAVTLDGLDTTALTSLIDRLPSSDLDSLRDHADDSLQDPLQEVLERTRAVRTAEGVRALEHFGDLLDFLSLRSNVDEFDVGAVRAAGSDDEGAASPEQSMGTHRADVAKVTLGYEERAVQQVSEILDSLIPVLERGVEDPVAELESTLQGVRVSPPSQPDDGRVRIVGLEDTPMAEYTHLFILGANREHFPSDPTRPRYFQSLGDELELFPQERDRALARYRFGLLLANAETVHVTTHAETMSGEDALPSPMLEELTSVATLDQTEGMADERRGSREDVQRALAGASPERLDDALESARANGVFSSEHVEAMRAGAATCDSRASAEPTRYDGQLDQETLERVGTDLTKTPFSPSRLNTYAECGFKYYLNKGLDLTVPEDISPDAGRFAVGDVVHQAMEFFYADLLGDSDGPVGLEEYERDDLEQRLLAAGQRAVDEVDADFASPFDRHQLRTIFAGLADPGDNEFYDPPGHPSGTAETQEQRRGLLVRILERELSDDGGNPLLVEEWFGGEDSPVRLTDETTVPVHGVIDRLDITADGDDIGARVIDYKTYHRDARDAIEGFDFQIPTYLLGARNLIEEELGTAPTEVNGEYRVFIPPATVRHPASLGDRVEWDLDTTIDRFLSEAVPSRIEGAIDGIRAGAFQPAVVGADDAGCHHCDYADVCDVRHHRRFDAIEAIDEADHPAYVPAAARPGSVSDHVHVAGSDGETR